ncbi:MAG TPA: MMPL family transporter [Actinomycetes bacterium]|jgi:RND superfamily putative drug exporter|nr:MMPL family transporter [Actinomycetes bacterium]
MRLSPQSVARWSARRRFTVIGLWVVLFLVGGLLTSRYLSGALTTQAEFTNNPDSKQARTLLERRLTGPRRSNEVVIVRSESKTVTDPEFKAYVQRLKGAIDALKPAVVQQATDPYQAGGRFVSDDRHATLIPVTMAGSLDDADANIDKLLDRTLHAQHPDGFQVLVAGEATAAKDANTIAEQDLRKGETIGIVAALAILIVVFGAVAAAVLPIVLAVMAIVVALGLVSLLGLAFDLSFFVTNMITMIGLAVGIDYSLFTVSRYREERARGRDKLAAIAAAGGTANRAVFFSGMTVVLALAGLLLNPTTIFRSIAAGAIAVVLVAVAASLTLLPALLAVMGDRVNALRVPVLFRRRQADVDRTRGFWAGVARRVMARPVASLLVAGGILAVAAVPLVGIRTGFSGISTFPDNIQSKQAFTVLSRDFSGGLTSPAQIVVDGDVRSPAVTAAIAKLQAALKTDRAYGPSSVQTNQQGDLALVSVPVNGDPSGETATAAVRHLRTVTVPAAFDGVDARVLVGGETAGGIDFFDLTHWYTPFAIALVLALSFLLLLVVFRSVVLPLLGVALNLLSAGAAYGLLVLVFQHGTGVGLFGFERVDTIESWLPLFLFSVLFGLSMDYQVFLLSRIQERYGHSGDNRDAVAFGLRTTGGIITGAAVIMVAVFAGFAAGRLTMLQQTGFGLAVAVLIDATLVRSVLVPAAMRLLGRRNWYLPSWLGWLPQLRIEGAAPAPALAEPERQPQPVR